MYWLLTFKLLLYNIHTPFSSPQKGKKKKNEYLRVSFVDWKNFKTNKKVILFYRKLASRSRNLNQRKSRSLLEAVRHFNVKVGIYYFCQFTILTPLQLISLKIIGVSNLAQTCLLSVSVYVTLSCMPPNE